MTLQCGYCDGVKSTMPRNRQVSGGKGGTKLQI